MLLNCSICNESNRNKDVVANHENLVVICQECCKLINATFARKKQTGYIKYAGKDYQFGGM